MQYIFKNKNDYNSCIEFLIDNNIAFEKHIVADIFVIILLESDKKEYIESKQNEFKNSLDINIDYGYMTSKEYKEKTTFKVGSINIGADEPVIISGPCSVENYDTMLAITKELKKADVNLIRAGAFKPRTSPYDFQGIGRDGVEMLQKISKEEDIPVVTEIMDVRDLDFMYDKIDVFQVGTRNMYNYPLLRELGKIDKPILLKRGFSATIKELLLSAEYIMKEGNEKIILCERGIRTFSDISRNTLDISVIPILKELTHLPVMVDPSHAAGQRSLIKSLSCAAIGAGADGLVIESHINPNQAWSDSIQTIDTKYMKKIVDLSRRIKREILL
ncbi:3-deoxy-7-phosphoheptulonate synthase [Peptostreptococcus equinus]|uniref:3-deoxy-7-phosphoheptulonate synthase n=1 Tax=Peptostreptococcus equinus TaxID=3003601 RepID=A0ABY7JU18_9FIRM|nr:3-deoxy-7-phosphoheptulonate synthase [Peptostreptococcus sp. CBA3647]WAW15407.1 3-deoxy-7-phosphoheptulonate synthase [Peptostreptococcus sp. CBA3647]